LELFGNKNRYFEHGGAKVNLADISTVMEQPQIDALMTVVEGLDWEISNNVFHGRRVIKTAASAVENDMRVFSGITITNSGKNSARIIHAANQYILEVTPDLATSPMKIGPALVNTTAEGMTLQAKSRGFISHALSELKNRGANDIAQRTVEMARNVAEGNPWENVRTVSLSGREGREYVEKTFPTQVKIADITLLVKNMANVDGADEIRASLMAPSSQPTLNLRADRIDHRQFAMDYMKTRGMADASRTIKMSPVVQNFDRNRQTDQGSPRAIPFTSPSAMPSIGMTGRSTMRATASPVMAERLSLQSTPSREMNRGPPAARATPTITQQALSISSPTASARAMQATPRITTPVITPILSRTTASRQLT
ncbi:MAG: hypothetical protein KAR32_04715, partial [Candidatus Omnitrophica bacterium]|nr:hypothetical protein [Candidatus Omnitrophota bacterium]